LALPESIEKGDESMSRRTFLQQTSALGVASLLGISAELRADRPPETTKIRLIHAPSICLAPQLLAGELLRLEGFSIVEYVDLNTNKISSVLTKDLADMSMVAIPEVITLIDAGEPVVVLGGIHAGCYELFGNGKVRTIRDLKGKRIVVSALGSPEHTYVSSIVAYVGMDPRHDVEWVVGTSSANGMDMFVHGKVDAFLGFPPQPQDLRAMKVGQLIVDTAKDRPWSQYFCCMVVANKKFVDEHPVATKRALRAILKGADICAQDPQRAARYLVEKNYESRYDVALDVVQGLPYRRWRDADPEDTVRFHALRLHEVGMIKSTPQNIIARGTDWRFLNELKKELKV
jgi:NitT/TauT family transport system substrate-binding protein